MKSQQSLRRLAESGVIAAMYVALSLCLAPLSFGPVQCRVAEALTLLPLITPAAIPGLAVGCVITNSIGLAMGANIAGAADILLGTLATLAAAILTRALRHIRFGKVAVLSALPPILINALVIGAELAFVAFSPFSFEMFALCAAEVGLGQLIACGGGLALVTGLERIKKFDQ